MPLGLTAVASAADAGIHNKILGSCQNRSLHNATTLTISNNEMNNIKLVKYLEDSDLCLKGVTKTAQTEVKEWKGGFLSMLLGTLSASLLGNLLTGQGGGVNRAGKVRGINRAGEGVLRTGYGNHSSKADFWCCLIL